MVLSDRFICKQMRHGTSDHLLQAEIVFHQTPQNELDAQPLLFFQSQPAVAFACFVV